MCDTSQSFLSLNFLPSRLYFLFSCFSTPRAVLARAMRRLFHFLLFISFCWHVVLSVVYAASSLLVFVAGRCLNIEAALSQHLSLGGGALRMMIWQRQVKVKKKKKKTKTGSVKPPQISYLVVYFVRVFVLGDRSQKSGASSSGEFLATRGS